MARPLGQIVLASFRNPRKLEYAGNGLYRATTRSGPPQIGLPGEPPLGTLTYNPDQFPVVNRQAARPRTKYNCEPSFFQSTTRRVSKSIGKFADAIAVMAIKT